MRIQITHHRPDGKKYEFVLEDAGASEAYATPTCREGEDSDVQLCVTAIRALRRLVRYRIAAEGGEV